MRMRRRTASSAAVLGAALLLAGCAAMPGDGSPGPVPSDPAGQGQDSQVVVVAVPPKDGEAPEELMKGFLDDLVSDEHGYETARKYLAQGTTWDPEQRVTVLDGMSVLPPQTSNGKEATVVVEGRQLAHLDANHVYATDGADDGGVKVDLPFTFAKNAQGQWRIKELPPGLILNQVDFQRIYQSVDLYYPARQGPGVPRSAPLVTDPVYLRSRIDPLDTAVTQLLRGPSDWLDPVVASAFPKDTRLARLQTAADGTASVYLRAPEPGGLTSGAACQSMAEQLYLTLSQVNTQESSQSGQAVSSVRLYRDGDGSALCSMDASTFAGRQPASSATGYYVGTNGHLWSVSPDSGSKTELGAEPVPQGVGIGSFAVAPDGGSQVAAVSSDGRALYVSSLTGSAPPSQALFHAERGSGAGLSTPSWDAAGTIWVADRSVPDRLLAAVNGQPAVVSLVGLSGTVTRVRVAADGVRIVLEVQQGGQDRLLLGRISREGTEQSPLLTVDGLHPLAPKVTSVGALSWYDGDSLIMLGQFEGSPTDSLAMLETDGSQAQQNSGNAQLLSRMSQVSAVQGIQPQALLGSDQDKKIWKLAPNSNKWEFIAEGSQPTYPG
ncbi:LpqB family beta-propeller domain-containing protein [Streptacidiphilus monticola]|uniref:LpqB family beta-propeller domain-containing protein n=1 Tax=Streptacidiphilus monticola TaxID=2161674 RepID=A0ABW1FZV5_9ACTN